MNKSNFIILLSIQIIIVAYFSFQFSMVETFGKKFIIHASTSDYTYIDNAYLTDKVYLDMPEMNEIPEDKWTLDQDLPSGRQVYVLLKETRDGSFQVDDVQKKRIKNPANDEVVVKAIYYYYDKHEKKYYLEYFFSNIDHIEHYGDFKNKDELAITIYSGPFGQYQITNIEKLN